MMVGFWGQRKEKVRLYAVLIVIKYSARYKAPDAID